MGDGIITPRGIWSRNAPYTWLRDQQSREADMAVYNFSALADGQAISFNPGADVLNFDQTFFSAANIRAVAEGTGTGVAVVDGAFAGNDVLLQNTSPLQLATSNVMFAN